MRFVYKFEAMTTPCEVVLFTQNAASAEACAKAILSEAKRLEYKYSYYREGSLLYRLNHRQTDRLDTESKQLIRRALAYGEKTNGIFDITVGTFKSLYRTETDPDILEIKKRELTAYTGYKHVHIKKQKLVFDNPYTQIDLGGFVKEFAVDRAAAIIKAHGIASALINFGGDMYALGRKEDGSAFRIGIKNPHKPEEHATYVELENEAIATSASYERRYSVGEQSYSHILSTGVTTNTPFSVSVIARSCVECGVYSTALMINPTLPTPHKSIIL